ncbi:MAG: hypothetical protein ABSB49_15485 [Polyangia bacterium]
MELAGRASAGAKLGNCLRSGYPFGGQAPVRLAVVASGAASLLAQVVLLRELLAFAQGNEMVLGIGLGVWLGFTAVAVAWASKLALTGARATWALYLVLSLAPLLYLGGFAATMIARPSRTGEAASLVGIALTALVALAPALVGGLCYAWANRSQAGSDRRQTSLYAAETLAAAGAGLLFHFVLGENWRGVWILWLAGAMCAGVAAHLAWSGRRGWVLLPLMTTVAGALLGPKLAGAVDAAHFPDQRLLALRPSRYGQLAVLGREDQRVFMQDGVLLFTSEDQITAEESVHLPLLLHPAPRRVLFLGGGLGGGLAEALKHRPERIDYVEIDGVLLDLARRFGGRETRAALADSRVRVVVADGRALLRQTTEPYDVIFVPAPVPQNALMARYLTRECFVAIRHALAPGGLLALATPGSESALVDVAARQRHSTILTTLAEVFPVVGVAPGSQTIFWAASAPVDARAALLAQRLRQRGLVLVQVGSTWLFDRLLPFHLASYHRALATTVALANRDFRPVVYLFGWLESLERWSPVLARRAWPLIASAGAAIRAVIVVVGALVLGWLSWGLFRRRGLARRAGPAFAMAAAGAAGMALELVLLLAQQALQGHLYHALGFALAVFMSGLALGAMAAARLRSSKRGLARACAGLALVGLSVAAALAVAPWLAAAVGAAIVPLLMASGAATVVGAAFAALTTSLVAIPLLGLLPVALFAALVCVLAALANMGEAGEAVTG